MIVVTGEKSDAPEHSKLIQVLLQYKMAGFVLSKSKRFSKSINEEDTIICLKWKKKASRQRNVYFGNTYFGSNN